MRNQQNSESLTGGTGVHVWLVLWKAARAVEAYAELSVSQLEICGSDFAVLEALLHKGPFPVNEIGKKILLTSGSIPTASIAWRLRVWSNGGRTALTGARGSFI